MTGKEFAVLFNPSIGSDITKRLEEFEHIEIKVNTSQRIMLVEVLDAVSQGFDVKPLEAALCGALKLNKATVSLNVVEQAEADNDIIIEIDKVSTLLKKRVASANGFMNDATGVLNGNCYTVTVSAAGAAILRSMKADKDIAVIIKELYGIDVNVEIVAGAAVKEMTVEEMQRAEDSKVVKDKPIEKVIKKTFEDLPICTDYAKIIYGEKIQSDRHPVPISDITPESGTVFVWGDVFSLEIRSTKDGRNRIITFNFYDGTASYSAKIFGDNMSTQYLNDKLKDGMTVLIRGTVMYDKYARENTVDVRS
ncbi:MAG: hypothetical protein IKC20_05025, partial [Clostridia bacterium]|nr:hypothetical protein [Clostridia bacterium]